ncbi:MAG: glycosyltransferase family 4 protein [Synechococcales cyanobacterium]
MKIIHVLRAPVGGLFRCALDLIRGQIEQGHAVGLVCDQRASESTEALLATLTPHLRLGIARLAIPRTPSYHDWQVIRTLSQWLRSRNPDVVHGHGAKGGAYARLADHGGLRVYTPHGGSLLERPDWLARLVRLLYIRLEHHLCPKTDLFIFESAYCQRVFLRDVGTPTAVVRQIHNGLAPSEFYTVSPGTGATDVVFIGELRSVKGVDTLLHALARLHHQGKNYTATIVGDGANGRSLQRLSARLGLAGAVRFVGAMPAAEGFRLGRLLVIPSRAESLPYIVMEALSARMPTVATQVGGIEEIYAPHTELLIPPNQPQRLAMAIAERLETLDQQQVILTELQDWCAQRFRLETMRQQVLGAYAEVLDSLQRFNSEFFNPTSLS